VESLTEDIMSMISEKPRHKALQSLVSMALADDGCYFKAVNPTPGTGIAQAITAAFSGTAGLLCLGNPATSDRLYYPEYIRLIPTVVPASATRSELLLAIDSILRYSSGGSTLTPRNARMGSDGASQADVKVGALVLAAESGNVRRLSRAQLRAAIPVAFEEFLIKFGSIDHTESTLGGATAVRGMVNVGPVVIEPGHSMAVHVWHPSNAVTGASWEVEVAWYERKK
jgi:hypothetical protein